MKRILLTGVLALGMLPAAAMAGPRDDGDPHDHDRGHSRYEWRYELRCESSRHERHDHNDSYDRGHTYDNRDDGGHAYDGDAYGRGHAYRGRAPPRRLLRAGPGA